MEARDREKYDSFSQGGSVFEAVKYTSTGVSFDEVDRQKAQRQKDQRTMELTIEEMLQSAKEENREFQDLLSFLLLIKFVQQA